MSNIEINTDSLENNNESLEIEQEQDVSEILNDFELDVRRELIEGETKGNLERLGQEIDSRSTFDLALELINDDKEKILNEQDSVKLESFNMFVGWNIMGSIFKKIMQDNIDPYNEIVDIEEFSKQINLLNISNTQDLQNYINKNNISLTNREIQVLDFLVQDNTVFSQEYNEKNFGKIWDGMKSVMPDFALKYNEGVRSGWDDLSEQELNFLDNISEKGGDIFSEMKDVGVEGVFEKDNWQNKTLSTGLVAGGLLAGGALALKGLSKLFGNKKGGGDGKKLGFLGMLKWGGILGVGGYLLYNWFNKDGKLNSSENYGSGFERNVKSFEQLNESDRKKYNKFSLGVDFYYKSAYGDDFSDGMKNNDMLGEYEWENEKNGLDYSGVYPYALDKRYKNIDQILSEGSFFLETFNVSKEIFKQNLLGWGVNKLKKYFEPFAGILSKIDGFTTDIFLLPDTEFEKKFKNFLDKEDFVDQIREIFRKNIKIISYLNSRIDYLKYEIIKQNLLENDPDFENKSETEKEFLIMEKIDDEKFMENKVKPALDLFLNSKILNANEILNNYGILDSGINENLQERLQEVDDWYEEILFEGEKGNYQIDDILSNFESWDNLDDLDKQYLNELSENLGEDIDNFGEREFLEALFGPYYYSFNSENINLRELLQTIGYDEFVGPWKKVLETFGEGKNPTKKDIENLKQVVDDFYIFQKEIIIGVDNLVEIREDGNLVVKAGFIIKQFGREISSFIDLSFKGEFKDGFFQLSAGTLLTSIWIANRTPLVKIASKPISGFIFSPINLIKNPILRKIPAGFAHYGLYPKNDFGKARLLYDFARGRLSLEKSTDIWNNIRGITGGKLTKATFLQQAFGDGLTPQQYNSIANIWENKYLRKQILSDKPSILRDFVSLQKIPDDIKINISEKLSRSINSIQDLSGNKKMFLNKFIKYYNGDLDSLNNILRNINTIGFDNLDNNQINKFAKSIARSSKGLSSTQINEIINSIINEINNGNKINFNSYIRTYRSSFLNSPTLIKSVSPELSSSKLSRVKSPLVGTLTPEELKDLELKVEKIKSGNIEFKQKLIQAKNNPSLSLDEKRLLQNQIDSIDDLINNTTVQSLREIKQNPSILRTVDGVYDGLHESTKVFSRTVSKMKDIIKSRPRITAGGVLTVLDVVLITYFHNVGMDSAKEMEAINPDLSIELEKTQNLSTTVSALTSAGALGAAVFIPGVGWAIGATTLISIAGWGLHEISIGQYSNTVDFYNRNFENYIGMSSAKIKQSIISAVSGIEGINPSLGFNVADMIKDEKYFEEKGEATLNDAIKALIHQEEIYNYTDAFIGFDWNLDNPNEEKIRLWDKEPRHARKLTQEEREYVRQRREEFYSIVNKRFEYIKNNNLLADLSKNIEYNNGIGYIEEILTMSRYVSNENEDEVKINELKENGNYEVLNKIFINNDKLNVELLCETYIKVIKGYNLGLFSDYEENLEYFIEYYNYKSKNIHPGILNSIISRYESNINVDNIDFGRLSNFLENLNFDKISNWDEIPEEEISLSEKYGISNKVGQNVLYFIARDVYSYIGENDLDSLKLFFSSDNRKNYGIYWSGNAWLVYQSGFRFNNLVLQYPYEDNNQDPYSYAFNEAESINPDYGEGFLEKLYEAFDNTNFINPDHNSGRDNINEEKKDKILTIINEERDLINGKDDIEQEINNFVKSNSGSGKIQIPSDLIIKGLRVGIDINSWYG
ncbi:hypothetical protein [Candidatus Vampirococcus lugosii]|uniref:Uncharacterized protein n=1 Tax=Candidatus Vampirococcus lugosii TaxID=2789015 RepID=A0ABS5QL85_9BACT|nr:hypothetical protein [Candidatus Vampirococcus lugosii]MBS8121975.1 hypothetical protein [Candidatus Vampirococcus lugosii]